MWLAERMGWRLVALSYTRSTGGGWHGEVVLAGRLDACTVIAAQAILGSDWAREAYNLMRVYSPAFQNRLWRARANVLYSTYDRRGP